VHAIELFSVGVEAHHPLLAQERADLAPGCAGPPVPGAAGSNRSRWSAATAETLVQAVEQLCRFGSIGPGVMAVSTMPFSTAQ
jgi:hypothetical protein